MKIDSYALEFSELTIKKDIFARLLGFSPESLPEPFPQTIDYVLETAPQYCNIQGGFCLIDDFSMEKGILQIGSKTLNIGKKVHSQIKESEKLSFFICTAGQGIGLWTKELNAAGDPMTGFAVDTLGSMVVEAAIDNIHKQLKSDMLESGKQITNRYSPGYCSWPVADQHTLFSFFPENFCGVSLTESALMHPVKSVSGIIGIGKNVQWAEYLCNHCGQENCIYRNVQHAP